MYPASRIPMILASAALRGADECVRRYVFTWNDQNLLS